MSHLNDVSSPPQMQREGAGNTGSANTENGSLGSAAPAGTSSSVLYTLLQDLGLSATAQALCEELQRQQVTATATATATGAPSTKTTHCDHTPSNPAGLSDTADAKDIGGQAVVSSRHPVEPPLKKLDDPNAPPTPPSSASPQPPPVAARKAMPSSGTVHTQAHDSASEELFNDLLNGDASCAAAAAALADFALEPLKGAFRKDHTLAPPAAAPTCRTVAAVEAALHTLWQREVAVVHPSRAAASTRDFRVAALITRAACCELLIAEGVFTQDYLLLHAPSSASSSPATTPLSLTELNAAQTHLVGHAAQLVAALQELLTLTGPTAVALTTASSRVGTAAMSTPLSSLMVARLHVKSLEWLRNAECVMAWVLRRQVNFEPPPQSTGNGDLQRPPHQQERKRRCLEDTSGHGDGNSTNSNGTSASVPQRPLQLQNAVLGLPTPFVPTRDRKGIAVQAPTFQQCLAAETASAAATTKTTTNSATPATTSSGPSRRFTARTPNSVRLAMTIQRVKLVLSLAGVLTYNGEHSIACTVVDAVSASAAASPAAVRKSSTPAATDRNTLLEEKNDLTNEATKRKIDGGAENAVAGVLRRWWTWRCVVQAQLLQQISLRLRSSLPPDPVPAPTAATTVIQDVFSFLALLEAHAKQLLLSPTTLGNLVDRPTSQQHQQQQQCQLTLAVALLKALEKEEDERAAWLDSFLLGRATAASLGPLPKSLSTATSATPSSAEMIHSPNVSVSSPAVRSEASSVNSPVWVLPLPKLPPPAAAAAASSTLSPSLGFATVPRRDGAVSESSALTKDARTATVHAATRVLRWQPHFAHLLTTVATGRWQAPANAQPVEQPCSRYNRTRLNLMHAVRNGQELVRVQPRCAVAASGSEYVPRPGADLCGDATRSLIEVMPRAMQLLTLQDEHVLRQTQRRLVARNGSERKETATTALSAQMRSAAGNRGAEPRSEMHQQPRAPLSPAARPPASPPSSPPNQIHSSDPPANFSRQRRGSSGGGPSLLSIAARNSSPLSRIAVEMFHALGHASASTATVIESDASCERAVSADQDSAAARSAHNSTSSTSAEASPESATWSPESAVGETAESLQRPSTQLSSGPSSPVPSLENEEQPSSSRSSNSSSNTGNPDAVRGEEESSDEEAVVSIYEPDMEGRPEGTEGEETDEEWPQSAVEVDEEVGEEEEEEEGEEEEDDDEHEGTGSEASSADLDYERAEDAMKEEVECVEVTADGRLLALLTARGRLTALRLQAHDSVHRYEEEVLLDAMLPHVPAKRLQWYESLSSFVRFSPCHRFVLASVQFLAVEEKQSTRCALARTQKDNSGEVCVFSLHRDEDVDDMSDDEIMQTHRDRSGRHSQSRSRSQSARPPSTFAEHVQSLLQPLPERLYECFRPHNASCLSARWVDPRWWGGGRRSRWANAAAEPLNTTTAAAAVVVRSVEASDAAQRRQTRTQLPSTWRVAAAVLLSEYHCLSIGLDDKIVRWMPSSGIVLQCILTEPVQDIIVSPMMAAFYVVSDAGDLLMYDAWDERDVGEASGASIWANSRDVCEYDAHPLMLQVTEDGHPRYYRTGASTQPYSSAATGLHDAGQQSHSEPSSRRRTLVDEEGGRVRGGGGFDAEVHKTLHGVHYTGPVTPVFQRMIDPIEKQRRRMQLFQGSSGQDSDARRRASPHDSALPRRGGPLSNGRANAEAENDAHCLHEGRGGVRCLPRSLRWLLPHRWTAHTPWDAQLGRRLIRHLLRRSSAPTYADEGQLHYERDDDDDEGEDEGHHASVMRNGTASRRQSHLEPEEEEDADSRGRTRAHLPRSEGTDASRHPSDFTDAEEEEVGGEEDAWEYDYTNSAPHGDDGVRPSQLFHTFFAVNDVASATAAAAARDAPVAVRESPSNPTPARGPLRRAYYPSGACLVYKSVARALCAAGDLADRQKNEEMGPGGPTHHLLSFALSGEPRWTPERRLQRHDADDGEIRGESAGDAHESHGTDTNANACTADNNNSNHPASSPPTRWSAAALARVALWKKRLGTLRHMDGVSQEAWGRWESKVLATSFHADLTSTSIAVYGHGAKVMLWSATQLLASRGYLRARDVWRRGAPATQRGLAATARNGRYLCIMASVGPFRKLENPREPLRNVKGFYACVVFDLYAGAVLRVIPVCPVDPSGLRGRNMFASQQHEMDTKMPIYHLQCSITIVPVVASAAPVLQRSKDMISNGDEEEDGAAEPTEIVAVTVGGLANSVYVFDAMTGRRLACTQDVEHQCGLSAVAACEAFRSTVAIEGSATATTTTTVADAGMPPLQTTEALPDSASSTIARATAPLLPPSASSSILPPSIRKPADVLASVSTWGRGTGFDGITDRSSSVTSSSSTDGPVGHGVASAVGSPVTVVGDSHLAPVPPPSGGDRRSDTTNRKDSTAQLSSANRALSYALAVEGEPIPRALCDRAMTGAAGVAWGLRGILAGYHQRHSINQRPLSSIPALPSLPNAAGGDRIYGECSSTESDWGAEEEEEEAVESEVRGPHLPQQNDAGNGKTALSHAGEGTAAGNGQIPDSNGADAAPRASALFSVYQSLLCGTSLAAAAASGVGKAGPGSGHLHAASSSRGLLWQRQRRRLLERVLRHYDVDVLWQAYVALFTSSTAAASALAPQSAVVALVQWAQHATANRTASTSACPVPVQSWVWCASRRLSSSDTLIGADPGKEIAQHAHTSAAGVSEENKEAATAVDAAHSCVPFAHVLQQREDFMWTLHELDAKRAAPPKSPARLDDGHASSPPPPRSSSPSPLVSLLSRMRTQAMLDGSLVPNAKLLRAQQRAAASRSTLKFPPAHHQNQLRLDVVNAVATWVDANGGFYVCFGSEDGGVYLLGGSVDA